MQLFFSQDITADHIVLPEDEAKHCIQVLRKQPGDPVSVMDGRGNMYETIIEKANKKACVLHIQQVVEHPPLPYQLHIAIAPPKNRTRFEWFLEKATEVGVTEITPIWTTNSERTKLRTDRGERIIRSAAKQCQQPWMPVLHEPISFSRLLQEADQLAACCCIPTCLPVEKNPLAQIIQHQQEILICIGPEGDFSNEELDLAASMGFTACSMGQSRLRSETAGIVACHTVALMQGLAIK